jgi:hypothetical protein
MRLHQSGARVLMVQALLLTGLAVAGLLTVAGSPTGVSQIAGLSMTTPHSVLLLVTAGASVLAALWSRIGRLWAMAQAVVYTVVFVVATGASTGDSQDTWLRLNAPDHFLHLGLALVGGVLIPTMFWPTAPGTHKPAQVIPGETPPSLERPATSSPEETEHIRDMIAAEVAVTEGHATSEQVRRVHEDGQRRADAHHRRAWKHFQQSTHTED